MKPLSSRYCIVGVGDAPTGGGGWDHWPLVLRAAKGAMDDAGVTKRDIDGIITTGSMVLRGKRHHVNFCEQMGLDVLPFTQLSEMGGSGATSKLRHAVAAIEAGLATTVLIVGADNLLSGRGRQGAVEAGPAEYHNAEFEIPYGPHMATLYALFAQRWMHTYGWTSEQLAAVAVAARMHGGLHPDALLRKPITVADVLASRVICSPFRLLDCSAFSDGGAAYIVTTEERARHLRKPPLYVLGVGGAYSYYYFEKWPDLVDFPRSVMARATDEAFAMAGLGPADIDLAAIADMFTVTVPIALEAAGFCKPGEGADFVQGGRIALGGELPVNTHGGNLAYGLPGSGAQFPHFAEVCRQLWGEAGDRQVAGARFGYLHNWSGNMSQHGTAVLGNAIP